jgi:hypothetical protein
MAMMMFSVALHQIKSPTWSEKKNVKSRRMEGQTNEHERQLLGDSSSNDLGVDDEALEDVLEGAENDVGREESFREGHSSVSAAKRTASQDSKTCREGEGEERPDLSSRVRSNH